MGDMWTNSWSSLFLFVTCLAQGEAMSIDSDYPDITMNKRFLFNRLSSMDGLSLLNPWHAARTLIAPNNYGQADGERHQRSTDRMEKPEYGIQNHQQWALIGKRSTPKIKKDLQPKYFIKRMKDLLEDLKWEQKRNVEIMRFGK